MFSNKLVEILNELEIKIPDKLLSTALTHSSKTFENAKIENYERLEFLGDSVLKLVISDTLYKEFPKYNEGRMTKIRAILVSDATLFEISKKINLKNIVIMGEKEEKDGGRTKESIIACAFEAILGAIFLSCGLEKATLFIRTIYKNLIKTVDKNLDLYNARATLQEFTQSQNKDLPIYKEISETGRDHNKTFCYNVIYQDKVLAIGTGKTKKSAQQDAAKKACIKLGIFNGEKDV